MTNDVERLLCTPSVLEKRAVLAADDAAEDYAIMLTALSAVDAEDLDPLFGDAQIVERVADERHLGFVKRQDGN